MERLRFSQLIWLFLGWCALSAPCSAVVDCPLPHSKLRSELKKLAPRTSNFDGSKVVHIHDYVDVLEKDTKWRAFAHKIREFRNEQSVKLNAKRNLYNEQKDAPGFSGRAPATGYGRMKAGAVDQAGKSVEEAFSKFYPDQNYELISEGNKILISPERKVMGQWYVEIIYDVSGNYFRMQKGKYVGNKGLKVLSEPERYADWNGNTFNSRGLSREEFKKKMNESHWNAVID